MSLPPEDIAYPRSVNGITKFTDNELSGVAQHFGIRGFPFWVLIDSNGDIVTRLSGSYTKDQFEVILSNLEQYDKDN